MKSICVYCGSSLGKNRIYAEAAVTLGKALVKNGITLVFGGGKIGLMGVIANTVISSGGSAIGVIPRFLHEKELAYPGLTDLIIAESMHERKMRIFDISDGFIAMPGGFGTVEEIFEMITWGQLQLHSKPCAFFNFNGYYDDVSGFIKKAISEGFIDELFKDSIIFDDNPQNIIDYFKNYKHPDYDKAGKALKELISDKLGI